jgi:hypothetical protein
MAWIYRNRDGFTEIAELAQNLEAAAAPAPQPPPAAPTAPVSPAAPAPAPVAEEAGQDLKECNYTAENEYCPKHGLEECSGTGMYESDLARIKSLSFLK